MYLEPKLKYSHSNTIADFGDACSAILPLAADQHLTPSLQIADTLLGGAISAAIASGDLTGKLKNQHLFLNSTSGPKRILVVGTGASEKLNDSKCRQLHKAAWSALKANPGQRVHNELCLAQSSSLSQADQTRLAIETLTKSQYSFDQFKSKSQDHNEAPAKADMVIVAPEAEGQLKQSIATAAAMDMCRDLGNLPGNICTPSYLAEQAIAMAATSPKVQADIIEEDSMAELGMHCLLSVGKGSNEASKLIILKYQGAAEATAPHVLVGKGITFDTGGISLKPGASMDEMKYDMCGAASVLAAMQAVIDMALPVNVVAIVASAENMPAGNATKPGDIVTTMSGKTVEILNTDAEGRLVLCDALTYAERFNPASVVDVATLTGACIIALGHHTSAVLSNDDEFAQELMATGKQAFDTAWQLPIGDAYQEQLSSNFADMANIGGRPAGTITAACFLARFAESYKWAHIDIAGTAWTSGKAKGATGRCVPLLVQHLINQA
ncbi:MAG: leucyl aminopeptidase [Gammaproteobacteria bacterium]|nr:leucyl aminopeptidase [Gammaproteobacteria bacterium]